MGESTVNGQFQQLCLFTRGYFLRDPKTKFSEPPNNVYLATCTVPPMHTVGTGVANTHTVMIESHHLDFHTSISKCWKSVVRTSKAPSVCPAPPVLSASWYSLGRSKVIRAFPDRVSPNIPQLVNKEPHLPLPFYHPLFLSIYFYLFLMFILYDLWLPGDPLWSRSWSWRISNAMQDDAGPTQALRQALREDSQGLSPGGFHSEGFEGFQHLHLGADLQHLAIALAARVKIHNTSVWKLVI